MGWTGGKGGSTYKTRWGEEFAESIRHPGASPKITEMLVERERGSRVDEPSVLRTGRVSILCLTGSGLWRHILARWWRSPCWTGTGSACARAMRGKVLFGRTETVLKGQKSRSRFDVFKGCFASDMLDLRRWMRNQQQHRTDRPCRLNQINRL